MNETTPPDNTSDVPWRTSDHQVRVPDASMLPVGERLTPAEGGILNDAVRGAHETIDRMAERAAPAVRQLADSVAAAEQAMQAQAEQLRGTRDAWVEGVRETVRANPLVSLAAAFALGSVMARLTR